MKIRLKKSNKRGQRDGSVNKKALAVKPDYQCFIPETHMVERENPLTQVVL